MKMIKNRKKALTFILLTLFTLAQPVQASGISNFFKNLFTSTPKPVTTLDFKKTGNYTMYALAATASLWTCYKLYSYLFAKEEESISTKIITLNNITFTFTEIQRGCHIETKFDDITLEKAQQLFNLTTYTKKTIDDRYEKLKQKSLPQSNESLYREHYEALKTTKEILLKKYDLSTST